AEEDDPRTRAEIQWYLADVLLDQNNYMQSTEQAPTRLEVLQEAAAAYQAVREYHSDASDSDAWISVTVALATLFNEQSKLLEDNAKAVRLDEAGALASTALAGVGAQTSPDTKEYGRRTLAYIRLHQAQIAAIREEATRLVGHACNLAADALRE